MKPYERIGVEFVLASSLGCFAAAVAAIVRQPGSLLRAAGLLLDPRPFWAASALAFLGAALWARVLVARRKVLTRAGVWIGLLANFGSIGFALFAPPAARWPLVVYPLASLAVAQAAPPLAAALSIGGSGALHLLVFRAAGLPGLAGPTLVSSGLLAVGTFVAGSGLREWREREKLFEQSKWAASQYALANVRLQDEMGRTEVWTRAAERDRIAREIHDAVGYALTAALVQISAAQEELRTKRSGLASRLASLEGLIRSTIGDVRREIRDLRRTDAEEWLPRMRKLCTVFADCTGIRVSVRVAEGLGALDDKTGEDLYRILQEALTNAFRHGRADYIDVAIGVHEGQLVLRVSDNGRGCGELEIGHGLRGIRERVGSLGGEVAWQTRPGRGFDLGITIPWRPEEREA